MFSTDEFSSKGISRRFCSIIA